MSQRSDIYRELRERIKSFGDLAGQQTTNDLLAQIDLLWRTLLRVRAAMIKTLILQDKIQSSKEVQSEDFLSLFLQIHNPKHEGRMCEHCCGLVQYGITDCPYCGEKVDGQNSKEFLSSIQIDIVAKPKGPNWNIDYSANEMLDKARITKDFEGIETLKPVTSLDEINGPKGMGETRTTTKKRKLSRTATELLRWARRRELCSALPLSLEKLKTLSQGELQLLAMTFKEKSNLTDREIWSKTNADLIQFIRAYQPQKPLDIGPPPVGSIPEINESEAADDE